jgi:hypothetical protein
MSKTANEIMNNLFLKENEAIVNDKLPTAEADATELNKIEEYIKTLKPNKTPSSNRFKTKIYQKTSDISASLLI